MSENENFSEEVREQLHQSDRQLLGLYGQTIAEPAGSDAFTGVTVVARGFGAIAGIMAFVIDMPYEEFIKAYPDNSDVFVRTNTLKTSIRLTNVEKDDKLITVWDRELVQDEDIHGDAKGKFVMFTAQQEYFGIGRRKGENLIRLAHKMENRNCTFADIVSPLSREEIEMKLKHDAGGVVITRVIDWLSAVPKDSVGGI